MKTDFTVAVLKSILAFFGSADDNLYDHPETRGFHISRK